MLQKISLNIKHKTLIRRRRCKNMIYRITVSNSWIVTLSDCRKPPEWWTRGKEIQKDNKTGFHRWRKRWRTARWSMLRMVKLQQQECKGQGACTISALELVLEFDLCGRVARMAASDIQSSIRCIQGETKSRTTSPQQITWSWREWLH